MRGSSVSSGLVDKYPRVHRLLGPETWHGRRRAVKCAQIAAAVASQPAVPDGARIVELLHDLTLPMNPGWHSGLRPAWLEMCKTSSRCAVLYTAPGKDPLLHIIGYPVAAIAATQSDAGDSPVRGMSINMLHMTGRDEGILMSLFLKNRDALQNIFKRAAESDTSASTTRGAHGQHVYLWMDGHTRVFEDLYMNAVLAVSKQQRGHAPTISMQIQGSDIGGVRLSQDAAADLRPEDFERRVWEEFEAWDSFAELMARYLAHGPLSKEDGRLEVEGSIMFYRSYELGQSAFDAKAAAALTVAAMSDDEVERYRDGMGVKLGSTPGDKWPGQR